MSEMGFDGGRGRDDEAEEEGERPPPSARPAQAGTKRPRLEPAERRGADEPAREGGGPPRKQARVRPGAAAPRSTERESRKRKLVEANQAAQNAPDPRATTPCKKAQREAEDDLTEGGFFGRLGSALSGMLRPLWSTRAVASPRIEVEYGVVLLDRRLAADPTEEADPTRLLLSIDQDPFDAGYAGGGTLRVSGEGVIEIFLDERCEERLDLEDGEARIEPETWERELYMKGVRAGDVVLTLALEEQRGGAIRIGSACARPIVVVALSLDLYREDVHPMGDEKVTEGRVLHLQDRLRQHGRARIVVQPPDPALWMRGGEGLVVLLGIEAKSGASVVLDESGEVVARLGMPYTLRSDALDAPRPFWVEGRAATSAARDVGVTLSIDRPHDGGALVPARKRNADSVRFTVVALEVTAPERERRQYVNLARRDAADQGRALDVEARVTPPIEGIEVCFQLLPGSENRWDLEAELRHSTEAVTARTDGEGIARGELRLSRFGGDVFVVAARLADDPVKLAGLARSPPITVWRKVYYQLSHQQGREPPSREGARRELARHFVELEESVRPYAPREVGGQTSYPRWMLAPTADSGPEDEVGCVGAHNIVDFKGLLRNPGNLQPMAHIVLCGAQWDADESVPVVLSDWTERSRTLTVTNEEGRPLSVFKPSPDGKCPLKKARWSWTDERGTVHGGKLGEDELEIPRDRGDTHTFELSLPRTCAGALDRDTEENEDDLLEEPPEPCPCEGPPRSIDVGSHLPATVSFRIRGALGPYAGAAGTRQEPHVLVNFADVLDFDGTLAHELGHMFGMVSPVNALADAPRHPRYYTGMGGRGPHCSEGAQEDSSGAERRLVDGTCIMFAKATRPPQEAFCDHCGLQLRAADLSEFVEGE